MGNRGYRNMGIQARKYAKGEQGKKGGLSPIPVFLISSFPSLYPLFPVSHYSYNSVLIFSSFQANLFRLNDIS